VNKATLLSGAAVAFDLKPRCSMENTVMPLHCSFVCTYLPVPSNIGRQGLLTHFHMALMLACVACAAFGHFVWPEDLLLILSHAQLHRAFEEGIQTLNLFCGLRVCF